MDENVEQSNKTIGQMDDSSIDTEIETCRLRSGLNEDCLLKIMEFLNVYDLIQMCHLGAYYKDLITKWIIGKKMLNLRGMTQSAKDEIFEIFGQTMRKCIIYESDFLNFLDTIIKYCAPGRLTQVELNLKQPMAENAFLNTNYIPLSMPILSNIRKFKLNVLRFQRYSSFDHFLNALLVNATNLAYLHLFHVDIEGDWLKQTNKLNLYELRILKPCVISMTHLKIFLKSLPKLNTFTFKGDSDITSIGTSLVESCPNLEVFEDIHTATSYRRNTMSMRHTRYNFLASFNNLKIVTLTSYTFCGCDLYCALRYLATTNIVQLKIHANLEQSETFNEEERKQILQSCSFSHFTSLTCLELDVHNYRLDGLLHCEFLMLFATQLKNLEKFSLQSSKLTNINKLIETLPQIRTFSISQITTKHLPVEMRKIVRTLRAIRQTSDMYEDKVVLRLIVNIEQWRELQVYKDIAKLTETIVDPFLEPYNHFRRCPSEIES
ncbi:uncharacterized protein LOC119068924 [Bradysia coprophila]|uniref:uncharacterized protein LOC119068924 n=1 Tax=Bradysia coprophila TaxID=38358 RepID=UPI00187D9989|nr:uncharacterized protein LOC119068924 [Bradysia coprophila]